MESTYMLGWSSCATWCTIGPYQNPCSKTPLIYWNNVIHICMINILCGDFVIILVEPDFLKYNGFGTHKYVTANGIKFHCVTCGNEDKPLMLFLHGFPEVSCHGNNSMICLLSAL